MSCHVATFAKDLGEVMSCHVATFAKKMTTYDIDICLNPDDIYAHPKRRHPPVVSDDLEDMWLRGDGWRVEEANAGRGVKRKTT